MNQNTFSVDPTGLAQVVDTATVELVDGDTFDIRIAPVANTIGDSRVRMLAYNSSIPGPTLRVRQGSEITVHVHNDSDMEATVHWHGLRLDNAYDGVPHETQPPIPVGAGFTYRLRFPDAGLYWYHPHVREDYGLDMGLYGNVVVDPIDGDYWPSADREYIVTLDDLLIEDGRIAAYTLDGPTHVAMGRFGNVMLTSGETSPTWAASAGEVVRFYFTNTANTRLFNVALPGARMKRIGGDSGRYEREAFVDEVLLAPSERAVVDVLFDSPGSYDLEHRTPEHTYVLGTARVGDSTTDGPNDVFSVLRTNAEMTLERSRIEADRQREPDKTLAFKSLMPLLYGDADPGAEHWTCPMHPEVISDTSGTCPICGMKLIPVQQQPAAAWTCPMHPEGISETSGTCPICGIKLIPVQQQPAAAWTCPMHPEVISETSGTCPICGIKLIPVQQQPAAAWTCPMHPEVISETSGTCPICGMKLIPVQQQPAAAWTCPMHPEVISETSGTCPICGMKLIPIDASSDSAAGHHHDPAHTHHAPDGLEWEDLMPDINRASDATNMTWKLVDRENGSENENIDWAFQVGDRIKIRLENDMDQDHPMHHPFHVHGAGRFVVLARDGRVDDNLVWKDTVLVRSGETVDILLDVTNPGSWMAHCHIAEHNQAGMMFSFHVSEAAAR